MFGSLKTVDLHNNKLTTLPDTFADLTALTVLDLSHNSLTSLPENLWALPHLTTLNLSHNSLTALPLRAPFDADGPNPLARTRDPRGDWFCQSITRATMPLPRLTTLDLSYNQLSAAAIDHAHANALPSQLTKIDLSANSLGECKTLLQALARLERLSELRMEHADIGNDSIPVDLLSIAGCSRPFPVLKVFDLGETHVTLPVIEAAFRPPALKQELEFEVTTDEPRDGVLRIILGKKVIKEAWEVEAERKAKLRNARHGGAGVEEGLKIGERNARGGGKNEVVKEAWEIEAEQGLLTEGARRRARAAAGQAAAQSAVPNASSLDSAKRQVVEKEPWEIEAEQGLLTAGAKRRARAAAAAAAAESKQTTHNGTSSPGSKSPGTPSISPSPTGTGSVLSNSQFYDKSSLTLTLPPSTLSKAPPHARSFSYAPVSKRLSLGADSSASDLALAIPTPTMPLAVIVSQPLAYTLRSLILVNRRKDPTFTLPDGDGVYLPSLEELSLEGCNLPDSVSVTRGDSGDETALRRTTEPLLPLLTRLFPNLRTLDLSYNTLTSAALTKDVLSSLILASPLEEGDSTHSRKGLRHIRLRGNRINDLDGFQGIAELFKGNRSCPLWKLEELDLRDNEIGKLPPELGLLPLDVFLVDGNLFRVPQRRIWEREGTKGLLTWLRMRIE
ncbi:L domain-like protein [Wolfiporia cocos MD-104 SS10]|uniref:L domain-like protein n=1 Tax=Wolfiporia cocos (strain MD-104) TaxID=742152 RepID=A0A2H3JAV9_WOLCO|nr:L domain-like protein [Wolfiporia cocos MD-104 SS10]